ALAIIRMQNKELAETAITAEPIGSGQACQVHIALHGGIKVAIKILRPSARRGFHRAANLLTRGARLLHFFAHRGKLDLVKGAQVAGLAFELQCDLRVEATVMQEMKRRFAWTPQVAFPTVIESTICANAYCMELICEAHPLSLIKEQHPRA